MGERVAATDTHTPPGTWEKRVKLALISTLLWLLRFFMSLFIMLPKNLASLLLSLSLIASAKHQLCDAFTTCNAPKHVNHARSPPRSPPSASSALSQQHHRHQYHHHPCTLRIRLRPSTAPALAAWPSISSSTSTWASNIFNRELGGSTNAKINIRNSQIARTATSTGADVGVGRAPVKSGAKSVNWPLWYVLPIAPYQRRKTLMEEVVPGKVGGTTLR